MFVCDLFAWKVIGIQTLKDFENLLIFIFLDGIFEMEHDNCPKSLPMFQEIYLEIVVDMIDYIGEDIIINEPQEFSLMES